MLPSVTNNIIVANCCARLATLLRRVATCWVSMAQIWKWLSLFMDKFVCVAWCCSRLARFVRQCRTRACAHAWFSIPNMTQHVVTGWPNARNKLRPKMMRYVVVLTCYEALVTLIGLFANKACLRRGYHFWCYSYIKSKPINLSWSGIFLSWDLQARNWALGPPCCKKKNEYNWVDSKPNQV